MSRETIYALRRFTEKLAYTPVTMSGDVRPNLGPLAGVPGSVKIPQPESRQNLLGPDVTDKLTPPTESVTQAPALPNFDNSMSTDPGSAKPISDNAHALANAGNGVHRDWSDYLGGFVPAGVDLSTLGGMGLGGLGAYGLARLLQSREDEEKQRFPWLSTLAGTAAGGLLLPALLNSQYAQQAGNAIGGAASNAVKGVTG